MRIAEFTPFIEEHARVHELKNCKLVIDAQNFFYNCYRDSKLSFEFGAECDQYAKYLRNYLSMFKKANIKCYFIFKGGTKGLEIKISKALNCLDDWESNKFYPVFTTEIHVEILKEMEFDYVFTEYENKSDCMTLARKISCPVVSRDIEFPLSGVQYISKQSLEYFNGDYINCKLFTQDIFLQKFRLDIDKIAFFILLTDESIFPKNSFKSLFLSKCIPLVPWTRNMFLLKWLSESPEDEILNNILKNTEIEDEIIFKELNKAKEMVGGEVNSEMAFNYFFNKSEVTDWFVSGVANNYVAKEYIDLYRFKVLFKQLHDDNDFMDLILDIIKYAYDLLTDFKNDGLKFIRYYYISKESKSDLITKSITKPSYPSDTGIFQNGWNNVRSLRLFEHFISETIKFDCDNLQQVPDDAKILIITLVYVSRISKLQKNVSKFTDEMAYGIILSYVILGCVQERVDNVQKEHSMTICDCESALKSLKKYFKVKEASEIMDSNLNIPLMQFQQCLLHMNYLNKLCGSPFVPTSYTKTYNGTFIYKIIYTMQKKGIIPSLNETLNSAPTVLKYFHDIIELYKNFTLSN